MFTAAAIALALATAAQAAPSRSSTVADVKVTTYIKGFAIGVTVRSDPVTARTLCKGIVIGGDFTPCRLGGSRYRATACAWRATDYFDGASAVISVTTTRARVASNRAFCPVVAQAIRDAAGFRLVRIR